jgi:Ca2+-binding EF-hand superfamily protein
VTRKNLLIALLSATFALTGAAFSQKASVPKQPDKAALARENVEQLLLLMDPDKNGKISKQQWMKFMETQFDRLDRDKKGQLDPKEVVRSKMNVSQVSFAAVGK